MTFALLTLAAPLYAQENATPQPAIDSPLLLPPSPTATALPTSTPTETPTLTPTTTPTPDLSAAALQVSPLRVVPNDRTINESSARPWLALAVAIVLTGAIVMLIAQRRT